MKIQMITVISTIILSFMALTVNAQGDDCTVGVYHNTLHDGSLNVLQVQFRDVKIVTEGDDKYLYLDVYMKQKGHWVGFSGNPNVPPHRGFPAIKNMALLFDYNVDVMSYHNETPEPGSSERVISMECVDSKSGFAYGSNYSYIGNGYQFVGSAAAGLGGFAQKYFEDITWEGLAIMMSMDYQYFYRVRWKIQPGATGKTGIKIRLHQDGDMSSVFNNRANTTYGGDTQMGLCVSGNLDIDVGGGVETPPVVVPPLGTNLACEGETVEYTSTIDGVAAVPTGTTVSWKVTDMSGNDASSAVEGLESTTTSASIKWITAGTYQLSMVAKKGELVSADAPLTITVNSKPSLTLKANRETACAESQEVTLTATSVGSTFKWYRDNIAEGGTQSIYTPTLPVVTNPNAPTTFTYKVAASKDGCTTTLEKQIAVNHLPVADINVTIANGMGTDPDYGYGDKIVFSPKNPNKTYSYRWDITEQLSVETEEATIHSAILSSYTAKLTVTGGGCSNIGNKTLDLDNTIGILDLTLTGADGENICKKGISRLTATATVQGGSEVITWKWYKDDKEVATENVTDGRKTSTYIAKGPGEYTVEVITYRGKRKSTPLKLQETAHTAPDLTVSPEFQVQRGGSATLFANATGVTKWEWQPVSQIADNHLQQSPKTVGLYEETKFFVYGTEGKCMSMDSTKVIISNQRLDVTIEGILNICKEGSTTLVAKVSGGTPPYIFSWGNDDQGSGVGNTYIFKHDKYHPETSYERIVTVTDKNSLTTVAKVTIEVANEVEPILSISGDSPVCENDSWTVTKTGGASVTGGYLWYMMNKNTGEIVQDVNTGNTLQFKARGEYRVWVSGITAGCSSDTASAKADVMVNGFDLEWNPEPNVYKLGGEIIAGTSITGAVDPIYTWTPLRGGEVVSETGYKVGIATEQSYTFGLKVQDRTSSCEKDLSFPINATTGGLDLTLSAKSVVQCLGGSVAVTATASGGSDAKTFKWYLASTGTAALKTTNLSGTSVTDKFVGAFNSGDKIIVEVTDASEPKSLRRLDTITVTILDSKTAPVISAGKDMLIAQNTSTVLFGEVSSGAVTTWNWSPIDKLASGENSKQYATTASLAEQTTFKLYAESADGCVSAVDDVIVNVDNNSANWFTIDIADAGNLCVGSTVALSATPTPINTTINSWAWKTTSNTLENASTSNPSITIDQKDKSTVFLKVVNNNGLTATASTQLNVLDGVAPILDITGFKGDPAAICSGNELTVVSTNGVELASAEWTITFSGESITAQGTSYTVSALDEVVVKDFKVSARSVAGCPEVGMKEETIIINPLPVLEWDPSSISSISPGDLVSLKAIIKKETQTDYKYTWSHEGSTPPSAFTDGGTIASSAKEAISTATGVAENAINYVFKVNVEDGRGCVSASIDRSLMISGDTWNVTVSSVYGDYCKGGSAILKAVVQPFDPAVAYTYTWYASSDLTTPISGETANEYILTNPDNTTEYTVKVSGGDKNEGMAKITLVSDESKTAAIVTAENQTIPKGTKTVLVASPPSGVVMTAWKWNPTNKLASGESTFATPYTIRLDATQSYTVSAVNANRCVSSKEVTVNVMNAGNPPDGADDSLYVKIVPSEYTICVNNSLQLKTETWATGMSYAWSPATNLNEAYIADPIFTSTTEGTFTYVVKVTKSPYTAYARIVITVKKGVLPILALDESKTGDACAGGSVVVKVTNDVEISNYIWFINGTEDKTITGDTYNWPDITSEKMHNVKVIAISTGSCISENTIEFDSLVKPATSLDLQRLDSCGQIVLAANAGEGADVTWRFIAGEEHFDYTTGALNLDTLRFSPNAGFVTPAAAYTVEVKAQPQGGGCQAKSQLTGRLFFKPKVKIKGYLHEGTELDYIMAESGKGETLEIVVSDESDYNCGESGNSIYEWEVLAESYKSVEKEKGLTLTDLAGDLEVVLAVKNKFDRTCMDVDTVNVYIFPKKPNLKIDTVGTSFVKAVLKLDELPADHKYDIYSRKWDPYCLNDELAGHPNYRNEAMISTSRWEEHAMDTLEFYYARTIRTLHGKTWESTETSDTVGYYLQDILVNEDATIGSNNYIPIHFDFKEMGCDSTSQLARRIASNEPSINMINISFLNYTSQLTESSTWMPGMVGMMDYELVDTLNTVLVNQFGGRSQFMQYGKLPRKGIYIKNTNKLISNRTWGYVPPQKANNLDLIGLFKSDFVNVGTLNRLLFEIGSTDGLMYNEDWGGLLGNEKHPLKPLEIILIDINNSSVGSFNWK